MKDIFQIMKMDADEILKEASETPRKEHSRIAFLKGLFLYRKGDSSPSLFNYEDVDKFNLTKD